MGTFKQLQAVESAAQSVSVEVFDALVASLQKSQGTSFEQLGESPPALLAATAEWFRRVVVQNGAPSTRAESAFKSILESFADEEVAPWVAVQAFQHFPALSLLRFFTQLFDARLAAPLFHVVTHHPSLCSEHIESWLAEVAPELSVPDYGFDQFGVQRVSLGNRVVILRLGLGNALSIEDESGKRLRSLPRARKTDDPDIFARGREHIQALRAGIRISNKHLIERFEDDMLLGRVWNMKEWCTLFLKHPLLQPIVRALVFQSLCSAGLSLTSFFVSEEGELLDLDLEPIELGQGVRIAYPDEMERVAWQTLFADAKIEQPFQQLHRRLFPQLPKDTSPFAAFFKPRHFQSRELCRTLCEARFHFEPSKRHRVYRASRTYGSKLRVAIQHTGHYENIFALNERDVLQIEEIAIFQNDAPISIARAPRAIVSELRRLLGSSVSPPTELKHNSAPEEPRQSAH